MKKIDKETWEFLMKIMRYWYGIAIFAIAFILMPFISHAATAEVKLTGGATQEMYVGLRNVPAGTMGTTTWWSPYDGTGFFYTPQFTVISGGPTCSWNTFTAGLMSGYPGQTGADCNINSTSSSYGTPISSTTFNGTIYTEWQHYFNVSTTPIMFIGYAENNYSGSPVGTLGYDTVHNTDQMFWCQNSTAPSTCDSTSAREPFLTFNGWNGGSPVAAAPAIEFRYPTSTTGLFSNWLLHASNLNASGSYEAQVRWTAKLQNGTVIPAINSRVGDLYFQYPDWYPVVPRTDWSYNFSDDVTINAEADLLSSQDPNNPTADLAFPIVIASTTESFVLQSIPNSSPSSTLPLGGQFIYSNQDASGTITISTTTGFAAAGLLNSTTTCPRPADWTDIGGGIGYGACVAINYLFIPGTVGTQQLNSVITSMQATPPFSWFFGINGQAINVAFSSSTTNGGIVIPDVLDTTAGHTSTITLLPADPTSNSYLGAIQRDGSSIINTAWNLLLTFCVLLLMFIFYRIIIM